MIWVYHHFRKPPDIEPFSSMKKTVQHPSTTGLAVENPSMNGNFPFFPKPAWITNHSSFWKIHQQLCRWFFHCFVRQHSADIQPIGSRTLHASAALRGFPLPPPERCNYGWAWKTGMCRSMNVYTFLLYIQQMNRDVYMYICILLVYVGSPQERKNWCCSPDQPLSSGLSTFDHTDLVAVFHGAKAVGDDHHRHATCTGQGWWDEISMRFPWQFQWTFSGVNNRDGIPGETLGNPISRKQIWIYLPPCNLTGFQSKQTILSLLWSILMQSKSCWL